MSETGAWYFGGRADGQHDELADIQYRYTMTGYVGHYLAKRPDDSLQISIESGSGYLIESQGNESEDFMVLYLGQRFNYWLTDFTRLYQGIAVFYKTEDLNDYQLIGEAGIETFLSDSLSFKAYVQDQYESMPAEGRKRNDIRLVTGLSFKF